MYAYFFFYFIKISFPVHFLFKWRQNLSARPHTILFRSQLHYWQLKINVLGTWTGSIISVKDKIFVCNSSLYSRIFYFLQNYALSSLFFPSSKQYFPHDFYIFCTDSNHCFNTHNSTDYSMSVKESTNKGHCC